MRLGQLARKLDMKPNQVRDLIRQQFNVEIDNDLNTRIEDEYANALSTQFAQPSSPIETEIVELPKQEPIVVESQKNETLEIATASDVVESTENTLIQESNTDGQPAVEKTEKTEADYFTPLPVDPNAELIKAPKVKLDGLKVVGKIDLPKPKEVVPESGDENSKTKPERYARTNSKSDVELTPEEEAIYAIYKDKKGIYHFSKAQRENRKNSLERIKREREDLKRKEQRVKHYQKIAEATEKRVEPVAKKSRKTEQKESQKKAAKPERKGLWGKFLNWIND